MIPARKRPALDAILARLNARMLRRHFAAVHVRGMEHASSVPPSRPVVFYANHSTWWDGLIAYALNTTHIHRDAYMMMEERQFVRYRFFGWIGAFSARRGDRRDAVRVLKYSEDVLRKKNSALWIFPQGVMTSADARPIVFESGLARIAAAAPDAALIPVAMRAEFVNEQRPEYFMAFGASHAASRTVRETTSDAVRRLTALRDGLRDDVMHRRFESFCTVVHGARSANAAYDRALGRP